ncbi:hypothetical protein AD929_13100 [Gluconobacter potus]|uniref:GapR-like DNA-binding domain-containing protein n=1 Tax=Gluconobacter potus TaxID=2724927 RepID=A0A149QS37_9PROT|nr:GapR family DNA-binding domain-containing protein [Gluconobacter potus]KXV00138.1 hypothetical protein AD929_13100 [Gluconobacter potus]MCE2580267.1 DUF2312 domain-containing protein [Komagataeibacter sp. FNDCR1]
MADAITGAVRDKLNHITESYVALEEQKKAIADQQKDLKEAVKELSIPPKVFSAAVRWKQMTPDERQQVEELEEEIDLVRHAVD